MFRSFIAPPPRELTKWCVYALVLLAPGSFVALAALWFVRRLHASASRMFYSRRVPVNETRAMLRGDA